MDTASRSFDADALRWFGGRRRARQRAMMQVLADRIGPADRGGLRDGLAGMFALDRTHHMLRAPRSLVARLHEPQVTVTLRNHLLDPGTRVARTQAIFDAVLGPGSVRLRAADRAAAEESAGPKDPKQRIDLLIRATDENGMPHCLAIEAKFGHRVTDRQLAAYRRGALHHLSAMPGGDGASVNQAHLILVAPASRPDDEAHLARDRTRGLAPGWHFLTWRRFLLRVDGALPDDGAHAEFRAFLNLVWDRCRDR